MRRSFLALAFLLGLTGLAPTTAHAAAVTRQHVSGDVYHYTYLLPVGSGPNARLAIHRMARERAPWIPRRSRDAIVLMHGDFATFGTNFAPAMAPWLAARNLDVWGIDRRWTQAPATGADLSDFDAMGITQELGDIRTALTFLRAVRLATDASVDKVTLLGFSRGGQLAYFYASDEATRPVGQRHVKGIVPYDVYASLAPEDEDLRQFNCGNAAYERDQLDGGEVDVPNDLQITTGELYLSDPDGQSPFFPFPVTNREWLLSFVGETYYYFGATPVYHLLAPVLDENTFVVGLTQTTEAQAGAWLAGATPHQSLRESYDTDALVCGDAPLPADLPLARIRVPLFLIAAAGGYGSHALHSTTQVGSSDVTTLVVRQLPVEREAEDFGHGDLLFSPSAAALAGTPLRDWVVAH